jgi:metallo-beta-lactamase class B
LSNHPGFDGTVAKLKAKANAPSGANPFVSGQPVVDRAMRVLNSCARAQKARFLITAGGGAGAAYASAADARDSAVHRDAPHDDADPMGAGLPRDDAGSVVPVAFPYSGHAGEHTALCEHGERS